MTKNNNTLQKDNLSEVFAVPKTGDFCFLDSEQEEASESHNETMDIDFAGGLRLLSFSEKIIQPFEKKFIIDALSVGLHGYSHQEKMDLAQVLPKTGKIARSLADMLLLSSEPDIQKYLLQNYAHHSSKALMSLAAFADEDTLMHIAERPVLKKQIVAALVNRQRSDVIKTALENRHAECNVSIIRALIGARVRDEGVCQAMLELPDMEPALALELFWSAPSTVRTSILRRYLKSHILVERHFARMNSPHLRLLPIFSATGPETINVESLGQGFESALEYFNKGQHDNALRLISLCASLPIPLLQKIFWDRGGEAVSVLFKALGLERMRSQNYMRILSQASIAKDWADPFDLLDISDMISWSEARMAISYWLWQTEACGPYQAADDERFLENIFSTEDCEEVCFEGTFGE